jgi:NADPH-dependent 2,4-dienoyl-CoA reductase/sulfur reductase-like enzyme/rhodanese-related sulfurtransferase
MAKRIVVVGGVAAGASAAAKARRTSEDVEIVLVEAGPYMSFANCGLPYYIGGEIAQRDKLFVVTAEGFGGRFAVDVRRNTTVSGVDAQRKTVTLCPAGGSSEELSYDRLILATGTVAVRPPIPGLDRDDIFTVRTVPDVDAIVSRLAAGGFTREAAAEVDGRPHMRALVIGGGYIGLETAEQLMRRGLKVTVVEMADQVMLALDREMSFPIVEALEHDGAEVILSDAVTEIADRNGQGLARTKAGREIPFDIGVLSVGVRANVDLARGAGLKLGKTGAIQVDRYQRTSDPSIYAAGDNSETHHLVLNRAVNIPLAGPANKAGRAAGANAALDLTGVGDSDPRRLELSGVLGTAVVRVCGRVAGVTGLTEAQANREGIKHQVVYMPGVSHASYYPGAKEMLLKVLYAPPTGKLVGAQGIGGEGVDKRIDVLATAITGGLTIEDVAQLDLCYAPPFGSAKDASVLAGFAGSNIRRQVMPVVTPDALLDEVSGQDAPLVLDVRTRREYEDAHLDVAIHLPVDELRDRLDEIPRDRRIAIYCAGGYRSYVAQQLLRNRGYTDVRNILGGYDLLSRVVKLRSRAQ